MISISDAARFSEESHATRKFKPWWETVVDYLIISLLILTLFSWAKVVTAEASGLLCIPVDPKIGYSYNLAKYFNSRCAQEFKDKVLLHYPYLLFFQWLLLSVFQKLWLKLPVVQNKFETFVELFKLLKETTKIDTTTSIGNDIWEVNRIDQVFNERSFLSILYTAKGFLITFSSASASCLLIAWISTLDFYKSDFECSLSLIYSPANNLVCNFQPVQYIYISIFCNVAIQLSITCISLYACYYSLTRKWEKHYRMSNSLRRYKAFKDLCFCVCFLKTSLQERQTILHALCRYATQSQNDVMATESRDYSVVKYVCDYLGLTIMESSDENSLENIGKQLNEINKTLAEIAIKRRKTIVLIHSCCHQKLHNVFRATRRSKENNSAIFLSFVRPNNIHLTSIGGNSKMFEQRRTQFRDDPKERRYLIHKAQMEVDGRKNCYASAFKIFSRN